MLKLYLTPDERAALSILAKQDYRDLKAQAAWIIRQELERRGLLPEQDTAGQPAGGQGVQHDNQ